MGQLPSPPTISLSQRAGLNIIRKSQTPTNMRPIFLFVLSAFCLTIGIAQNDCMQIGTNFHFFDAGVYKDLKKSSTHFFTRNETYLDDGNDWDSGLAGSMSQDAQGYPLEIPFPHPTTGENQILAFTVGGYHQNYQTGNYVLLYEGDGTIEFASWTSQTVISSTSGRIEFSIDAVNENGIHIEIKSSTLGNHIRNIRIVRDIHESNYQTEPYLDDFMEKVDEFAVLRMMDWSGTNNHTVSKWEDRTQPDFHTQALEKGIAWEEMIQLANLSQKDIWMNVPHLADEAYIDSLAVMFRDLLDPDLQIYLEYSNECWNWIFDQTHWMNSTMPFPGNFGKNYGHYSHQVFSRWDNIFGSQKDRIETVLAGHDYFVLEAFTLFDSLSQTDLVDLVSYPGYVALNEENYDTLSHYGTAATPEMVMDMLNENIAEALFWMLQFKIIVADAYNKEFVMYEGGQHITPQWFGLDTTYNQALYDAQIDTAMYTFYTQLLDVFQDSLEVRLFMNYVLASPRESSFGSWGLIETYHDQAPFPPKWNAVMNWKHDNPCERATAIEETAVQSEPGIRLFPNPARDQVRIVSERPFHAVELMDIQGRQLGQVVVPPHTSEWEWRLPELPSALYLIRIRTEEALLTQRLLIN